MSEKTPKLHELEVAAIPAEVPSPFRPLWQAAENAALHHGDDSELPSAAIVALENGLDGHYLRQLAGWTAANQAEPRELLLRVFEENGLKPPEHDEIVRRRLLVIVERFLDGRIKIKQLANAMNAVIEPGINYENPGFVLWCYASDYWREDIDEGFRGFFESRAYAAAIKLKRMFSPPESAS